MTRQSIAAAALIRRTEAAQVLWLARWSRSWKRFHLVGGHKHDEESFRECLVREIGEELGLVEDADYEMAAVPTAHLEFTAWSEGAKEEMPTRRNYSRSSCTTPRALKSTLTQPTAG